MVEGLGSVGRLHCIIAGLVLSAKISVGISHVCWRKFLLHPYFWLGQGDQPGYVLAGNIYSLFRNPFVYGWFSIAQTPFSSTLPDYMRLIFSIKRKKYNSMISFFFSIDYAPSVHGEWSTGSRKQLALQQSIEDDSFSRPVPENRKGCRLFINLVRRHSG